MIVAIIFVVVTSCYLYSIYKRNNRNFPPGPYPLPILGSAHIFQNGVHVTLTKYSKKYGPIVGLTVGGDQFIAIHGYKLIRDVFAAPQFIGRPMPEANKFIVGDREGIIHAEGEAWVERRRFTLRNLRDFGFGKSTMEENTLEEVTELIDWLKKRKGEPVELQRRLSLAGVNALWKIMSGERYSHDDEKLTFLLNELERTNKIILNFKSYKAIIVFFYPRIAKFFPNWSGWNTLIEGTKPKFDYFDRIIREHEETLQEDSPRDFIDTYLSEIRKTTDPDSAFHPSHGTHSLQSVMSDLFLAGSDTLSITMSWAMLYLLHNPKVEKRLQADLDHVVGRTRLPSIKDRKDLPYVEAFINEVLRIAPASSFGVPHGATEDTKLAGYDIPKGTAVMANLYDALHDPKVWAEPESFRPERFLSPDEKACTRPEALITFGTGRRVCLGETLARDSLFLYISCLVQAFDVGVEAGKDLPTLDARPNSVQYLPTKYEIVMKERA